MIYLELLRRASTLRIIFVAITIALGSSSTAVLAQDAETAKILEACRNIQDSAARLRCLENLTSSQAGSHRPPSMEGWRLVRTPPPGGGKDAVSIIHTPDLLRSDPDLAGLMIRCGGAGNEVLIVVITPFPPRARPQVLLGDKGTGITFQAKVVPPGASILLPSEANALATGPWQLTAELPVQITEEGRAIRGIIPLKGLSAALPTLNVNCPPP